MKFQMKSRKPVDLVFQVREAPLLHSYPRLQGHVRGPKPHQQCVYRSRRAALIAGVVSRSKKSQNILWAKLVYVAVLSLAYPCLYANMKEVST